MAIIAIIVVVGIAAVVLTAGGTGLLSGKLSASDIAGYAQNAGFRGQDAILAVSVALAESGGDPNAVGDLNLTPGGSVGLWQINLKAHPEYDPGQLTDPQYNANAAYNVYMAAGGSFSPWSTYAGGQYSAFIVQAQQGVNG